MRAVFQLLASMTSVVLAPLAVSSDASPTRPLTPHGETSHHSPPGSPQLSRHDVPATAAALRLGCANFAAPQRNRPLPCPAARIEDSAAIRCIRGVHERPRWGAIHGFPL